MTGKIGLVACCGQKLRGATKAADLYQSPLFTKSRTWIEARCPRWYILSALHGLVDPAEVVSRYDVTLTARTRQQRREWAQMVFDRLRTLGIEQEQFIALAGRCYTEDLAALVNMERPMQGLGIGEQLGWLTRANTKTVTACEN